MSKYKQERISPQGYTTVTIAYSNLYHVCLTKLVSECSLKQGECGNCPVAVPCNEWWDSIADCKPNCGKITSENFPYLVLQFLQFREKGREKIQFTTKMNNHIYQKELIGKAR